MRYHRSLRVREGESGLIPNYAWTNRPPSHRTVENKRLLGRMREIHTFSRETYGQPRIYAELRDDGWQVNHKRVRRLMKLAGLQGATRRKKWRTTKRAKDARPAAGSGTM